MDTKRWPVIDTSFTVGVSPNVHFFGEEQLIPFMDENGVDMQIIYQPDESFHHETPDWNPYLGNDYIAKIEEMYPDRVLGLATVQAWHQASPIPGSLVRTSPALEELDRAILDLGLHGLRVNPMQHNIQINNRDVMWPVLRRLSQLQEISGRRLIVSVHAYADCLNCTPEALAETAREFPDIVFLMQHTGFVWAYATVCEVAAPMQNIFFDITAMPQKLVAYKAYLRFGARKFCIGVDGPFASYDLKLAILNDFAKDDSEAQLILGGNIAMVLGIPQISGGVAK